MVSSKRLSEGLPLAQGVYYLVTGVWPFISMETFQAITGPKVDGWLVKMVGALVTVVGGVLFMAGLRRRVTSEITVLAVGNALAFMGIDITYAARKRISPIYLADAVLQVFFLIGWISRPFVRRPRCPDRAWEATTVKLSAMR